MGMTVKYSELPKTEELEVGQLKMGGTYELVRFHNCPLNHQGDGAHRLHDWYIGCQSDARGNRVIANLRNGFTVSNSDWYGRFVPVNLTVSRTV